MPPDPPYFANFGPLDGPIRDGDCPSAIGVFLSSSAAVSDGIAYGVSHLPHWRGPLATFRLVVRKEPVPGFWVCVGRQFIPVQEWEEREAMREQG